MAQNAPLPAAAPLHDAAGVGDPVAIAGLLKDGVDHNTRVDREGYSYSNGATALHIAAREDHLSVAVALLAAGAWPDGRARDEHCEDPTPLHEASARGGAEVAKALLNAGARTDILAKDGPGPRPVRTALSRAVENGHLEVVRTLAEDGAAEDDPYGGPPYEEVPLVTAVKQGNADVALVLLDAGADVDGFGPDGFTALHEAKDVCMMELLLDAGARIDQELGRDYYSAYGDDGCDEGSPICWLCCKTHQRFSPLQKLGHGVKTGAALSSESEIERATAMVQLLIRRGAEFNYNAGHCLRTGARGNPLSAAVYNGTTAICAALLDNGADLDVLWHLEDPAGERDVKILPLHDAARFGDVDILRLLLAAGAGANSWSNFRRGDVGTWCGTPLHVACRYSQLGCVRELLRWGADLWAKEKGSCEEEEEEVVEEEEEEDEEEEEEEEGEEEEGGQRCDCVTCWSKEAGKFCRKTPAEVIGLRDFVTKDEINARPSDSTTVGDGDEIRRELLWWRRGVVVMLAARLAKQMYADDGTNTSPSAANKAQQTQVLAEDDELLAIAGRMAGLGGSGQGVFRHIVTFL